MTNKLCIYWEANGGRGYSSPTDDTPDARRSLEQWAALLHQGSPHATFTVTEPPIGRFLDIAGKLTPRPMPT